MPMKKTPKKTAKKTKVVKKAVKVISHKQAKSTQVARLNVVAKPFNRAQIIRYLSATSGLQKKDVLLVMDALNELVAAHLRKRGPGEFTFLGLAKFRVIHKPAVKSRKGINPFTGEPTVFAAKPARQVVKIRPLKKIKEMAV